MYSARLLLLRQADVQGNKTPSPRYFSLTDTPDALTIRVTSLGRAATFAVLLPHPYWIANASGLAARGGAWSRNIPVAVAQIGRVAE